MSNLILRCINIDNFFRKSKIILDQDHFCSEVFLLSFSYLTAFTLLMKRSGGWTQREIAFPFEDLLDDRADFSRKMGCLFHFLKQPFISKNDQLNLDHQKIMGHDV